MYDHNLGRETKDFTQLWAEFHVSFISLIGEFIFVHK